MPKSLYKRINPLRNQYNKQGGIKMYPQITLDYQELSPYLNQETITIHYQIYLDNLKKLNQLLNIENYDYSYSLKDLVQSIEIFHLSVRGEILYYLSSVLNHNLYFYNISGKRKNQPIGMIKEKINQSFGNYQNFKNEFQKQASNLKGSGYTFLVLDEKGSLKIINTSNEDSPYYYGMIPIICLDLWEHAYFLQYQNDRQTYINNFFELIDFEKINHYYEQVTSKKNIF